MIRWLEGLLLVLLATLAGCGGGGGGGGSLPLTPATTPLRFDIAWGARSRAIVSLSSPLSVVVTLSGAASDGSDFRYLANRPDGASATTQSVVSPASARTGSWPLTVRFYAQPDGTGDIVGTANATVTLSADGTGIGTVATDWKIKTLEVAANQSLKVGEKRDIVFTARAADNALLAITPGSALWQVNAGSEKLRFVDGSAEGLRPGTADVTITVDNISTQAALKVTSDAVVAIDPAAPTLAIRATQNFTATVSSAPETGVTWSVQEGAAGGTITAQGVYTAPGVPGTYHVVATSQYDPAKSATATVSVKAGSVTAIIR